VQVALRHCSQSQRDQMLSRLLPRCLALSASKHGSNVAELLLVLASAQQIEGVRASVFGGTPKARQTLRQVDLLPLTLTLTLNPHPKPDPKPHPTRLPLRQQVGS